MKQSQVCSRFYATVRKQHKAPVMIAVREWPKINTWYVEAKDGSFSTRIHREHCSWCAKAAAVSEWKQMLTVSKGGRSDE